MKKPNNLTLKEYWEANSSEERKEIVENAFKWIDYQTQIIKSLTTKHSYHNNYIQISPQII